MDMIGKIRWLHGRGKKSEREIAGTTGLSRNTEAKWLSGPLTEAPKYRRGPQPGKLTVFAEALKISLKVDAHRPKHERRTARALYAESKAAGCDGGYSRVTDWSPIGRARQGADKASQAAMALAPNVSPPLGVSGNPAAYFPEAADVRRMRLINTAPD